jgi:hypothetical protein
VLQEAYRRSALELREVLKRESAAAADGGATKTSFSWGGFVELHRVEEGKQGKEGSGGGGGGGGGGSAALIERQQRQRRQQQSMRDAARRARAGGGGGDGIGGSGGSRGGGGGWGGGGDGGGGSGGGAEVRQQGDSGAAGEAGEALVEAGGGRSGGGRGSTGAGLGETAGAGEGEGAGEGAVLPAWLAASREAEVAAVDAKAAAASAEPSPHAAAAVDGVAAVQARTASESRGKAAAAVYHRQPPSRASSFGHGQQRQEEGQGQGQGQQRRQQRQQQGQQGLGQGLMEGSLWLLESVTPTWLTRRVSQVGGVVAAAAFACGDYMAQPAGAAEVLAAELVDPRTALGGAVAAFVEQFVRFCAACEDKRRLRPPQRQPPPQEAGVEAAGAEKAEEVEAEVEEVVVTAEEAALQEAVGRALSFEAELLELCYAHGRALEVAAQAEAEGQSADLALLALLQRAYQPAITHSLRALHAAARAARADALRCTRGALRVRHPEVIGLREELVSAHGVPRCSVLEASWLYSDGTERLDALPRAATVAAKVRVRMWLWLCVVRQPHVSRLQP